MIEMNKETGRSMVEMLACWPWPVYCQSVVLPGIGGQLTR